MHPPRANRCQAGWFIGTSLLISWGCVSADSSADIDWTKQRGDMVGLDASILMHADVWKASGHVDHFTDPMVDCRDCKRRFRADQLEDRPWTHFCAATKGNKFTVPASEACKHCGERRTLCPECGKGELTAPRQFNLMFKTFMGPVEEAANVVYLRPETAQGIYVNFLNVQTTARQRISHLIKEGVAAGVLTG